MKIYILVDIEEIAGWVFWSTRANTIFNFHHLQRMNRLLTNEVNAAVKAAFDAGATEVYVNDNHAQNNNKMPCTVVVNLSTYISPHFSAIS